MKPRQIFQELEVERMQVESEIKKLQIGFYRDRKISEREYKIQFKVLNERLAEMEGERTTLELLGEQKKGGEVKDGREMRAEPREIKKADVEKIEEKIEKRGKFKIILLEIVGVMRHPISYFKKMRDGKRGRVEAENKAKVDEMLNGGSSGKVDIDTISDVQLVESNEGVEEVQEKSRDVAEQMTEREDVTRRNLEKTWGKRRKGVVAKIGEFLAKPFNYFKKKKRAKVLKDEAERRNKIRMMGVL